MKLIVKMASDSVASSPETAQSDANSVPNSPGCNITKADLAKTIIAKADAKVSRSSSFKTELSPNNTKKNEKMSRSSSFKEGVCAIKTALSRNSSFKESGKVSRSGSFKEGVTALLSGVGQLAAKMSPRSDRKVQEDCTHQSLGHSVSLCLADAGGLAANLSVPNSPFLNRKVNENVLQSLVQDHEKLSDIHSTKISDVGSENIVDILKIKDNKQNLKPKPSEITSSNGQCNVKSIPTIEIVTAKITEINVKTVIKSKSEINNNAKEVNKAAVLDKSSTEDEAQTSKEGGFWSNMASDFLSKDAEKEVERRKRSDAKNAPPIKRASLVFGVALKSKETKKSESESRNITPVPNPIILDPVEHRILQNKSPKKPSDSTSTSLVSKVKIGPIAAKYDVSGKVREEHQKISEGCKMRPKSLNVVSEVNIAPKLNCDKTTLIGYPNTRYPNQSLDLNTNIKSAPNLSETSNGLAPKTRDGLNLDLEIQKKICDTDDESNQDQPMRRKAPILTKEEIEAEISPFGVSLKHIPKWSMPPTEDSSPDGAPYIRRKSDDLLKKSDDSRRNSLLIPLLKPVSKQPVAKPLISTPTEEKSEESGLFGVKLKTAPKREYSSKSIREITPPKTATEVITALVSKATANLPKTPDGSSAESIISAIKKARRESAPAIPTVPDKPSKAQVDSIKSAKDRGINIWDRYWKNLRAAFTLHRQNKNDKGPVSPFHDIPLFANEGNKIFNMVVEVPRWTNAKMEISTTDELNPIKQDTKKGKLRFVANCFPHKGYIWNYGALPQTWEDPNHIDEATGCKGDNDPIDVCEIGYRVAKRGEVVQVKVLGVLAMIDEGETDWKLIAIDVNDPLAPQLSDIADVEEHMPGFLKATVEWFKIYKMPDGKPENQFAFNGAPKDREFAHQVIMETHEYWKALIEGRSDAGGLSTKCVAVNSASNKITDSDAQAVQDAAPAHAPAQPLDPKIDVWHYVGLK